MHQGGTSPANCIIGLAVADGPIVRRQLEGSCEPELSARRDAQQPLRRKVQSGQSPKQSKAHQKTNRSKRQTEQPYSHKYITSIFSVKD
jgi:hypothetical protein